MSKSMNNGNGPVIQTGSPVPPIYRNWEFLAARPTTFWEFM
jgi:hypothetical protein